MMPLTTRKHVQKLHARLVDSLNGYETALDRTEDASLRRFIEDIAALRREHAAQLGRALDEKGLEPQPEGGWMTVVHESIMKVRDAFGKLDDSAKDDILKGEQAILDLYDEAIEALDPAPEGKDLAELLRQQRATLDMKTDAKDASSAAA